MSHKKVRAIYEARLATWAAARSPVLRVAFQNQPFVPATGTTYLQAFMLPADTANQVLDGSHRAYTGVFQVSVVAPINTGPGAAEGIADELAALFVNFARLSSSGFSVIQTTPARVGQAIATADSFLIPVSFEYRADTTS